MFSILVALINQSTQHTRIALMTRIHTGYGKITAGVTEGMEHGHRVMKVRCLERAVKEFKQTLVEAFDNYSDSGLYTLRYHLLYHMVKILTAT